MNDKDIFKDLISEKLRNYEANVNPQLWNSISSKLAATSVTSTAVGTSLLAKFLIGGSISVAALTGAYFLFLNDPEISINKKDTTELVLDSESKKVQIEKNTKVKQVNSAPHLNVTTNTVANESDKEIVHDTNKESLADFGLFNQPLQNLLFVELPQEIGKTETPKVVEAPIVVPTPNKTEPEKTKDPLIETKYVDQSQEATISTEEVTLYSTIFTPNGDGLNDLFFIKSKGLNDFSIVIMNSKNRVVFRSNDPDFVWDGISLNGEPVEDGKYVYYLTAYDKNGKPVNKYKQLMIKRN